MRFTYLTTGLVASMFACPWFVAQESSPAPSAQKPGYSGTSQSTIVVARQPGQQGVGQTLNSTVAPSAALPQVPAGYTERTIYPYGNPSDLQPLQWLNPNELPDVKSRQAFAQAYRAYQSAGDDAARSKATAELKAGLEKQYDAYVEAQAKQITQLEERLQKLKEQLEKRRSAKERMVELKLQMVLSQAEGLGFPDSGFSNQSVISQQQLQRYSAPPVIRPNASYPGEPVPSGILPFPPVRPVAPQSLQGLFPPGLPAVDTPPPASAPSPPRAENGDQNKID